MSFFASSSYKPQIRQEGFHLPSPDSPSAHSPPSPPPSATTAQFESGNSNAIFMPQNFLPDAFRKYPAGSGDTGSNSMDFGDELASMMANSPGPTAQHHGHGHHHQSSHERSTQSPNPSGDGNYDDGYRPPHNIFDISAPLQHHQRSNSNGFPSHFSLPPTSHRSQDNGPLSQPSSLHNPSSLHHQQHVHDYGTTHNHFNSTLPALNSSMRFDPHPPGSSSHDLPPPSSFNYPAGVTQTDYRGQNRSSPSPIGTSRSRSRSRAPSLGPTRTTTRTRRHNSVSSTSPPPLPGRPSAIIIPGSHRHLNGNGNGVPVSPLSMHSISSSTSGWFMPAHGQHPTNEYSLPTPESITNPFGPSFPPSNHPNLGISPSEVTSMTPLKDRPSSSSLRDEKSVNGDPVTKQAILANEKRRRRRESHNAVERRRRDNINEKISELATLIPECMLDPSAPVSSPAATDEIFNPNNPALSDSAASIPQGKKETSEEPSTPLEAGVVKANKGMILRKSVEYIRYLQQLVSAQANRNRELEQALSVYREVDDGEGEKSGLSGDLSAELALNVGLDGICHAGGDESVPAQIHTPTSNDSPRPSRNGSAVNGHDDMGGLTLHEEVGDGYGMSGMNFRMGYGGMPQGNGFHGFELASMPEDTEMDDRPTTGMTMSGTSPSVGSGEGDDDGRVEEEEERGRRGRDGRVRNSVKKFEEAEESSGDSRERREMPKAMET